MCGNLDICAAIMTSANLQTDGLGSKEPSEITATDSGVVMEFISQIDDDVIKRIPILGPTRKQTELFFLGKHEKPCTADPIRRRHPDQLHSSHFHDAASGNRPSSSYNAFNPQQTNSTLWLKKPAKPPKHSPILPRPTAKSVSMVTANSASRSTFQTYDAIIKQGNSLLTHWPNSGYDTPPRYCVINSIGNNNNINNNNSNHYITSSRENSSTTLKKSGNPAKDLANPKTSQSFVITADTSSLLVQSKLTVKSAAGSTAVGARARAKSAIQKVSEANNKSLVKSRSAKSRFLQSRSKQYSPEKATPNNFQVIHQTHTTRKIEQESNHNYLSENTNHSNTTQENASSVDNRSPSPKSSNYLKRYSSDTSLHPKNQRKIRSGTKQGRLSPRVVPVEDYDQSFLVVQRASTQVSLSKPHTPTRELTSSPMATRRKNDYSTSNGNSTSVNKQMTSNKRGKDKTLTPSKHGYHPRSNSPTFKRLVQAVERLNETTIGMAPFSPVSKSTEDGCGDSVSTDSHPGYRNFKDCYVLNDFTDSDLTESDGNSRKMSDVRLNSKTSRNSRPENSGSSKNSKISHKAKRFTSETRQSRETKPAKSSRDSRAMRNSSLPRESAFLPEEIILPPTGRLTSEYLDDEIGAYDSNVTKEPETRIQEGQPTQLHFFLPQLADSVSEVSGATATARSYYQEQRLELLSRNEEPHHDTDHDLNYHNNNGFIHNTRGKHQNGAVGSIGDVNAKYTRHIPPPPPSCDSNNNNRSTSIGVKCQSKQKHYSAQNGHGDKVLINTNGDRCLPRDFRNGHWNQSTTACNGRQSPNKDESSKHKRYVSPARNKNCNNTTDKGGARRKQLTGNNSNNNNSSSNSHSTSTKPVVTYEHDFLDGQLPSEKLKKQIDNFPTLVSMEYSESPTPQQVR